MKTFICFDRLGDEKCRYWNLIWHVYRSQQAVADSRWVYALLFQLAIAENNMAGLGIKRYFEKDRIFKYVNKTEENILCQYIFACTNYNKKRFRWQFVKLRMFLHISSNMKEKKSTLWQNGIKFGCIRTKNFLNMYCGRIKQRWILNIRSYLPRQSLAPYLL